ncbi:high affinity immunoglobulin epsilon receptor subunit alpha isoform X2 [Meles meles]|uniref:high affinity immunoglobulin epsilon receptor subunit alpha isoform X2 n=1 Tax=Meles meles TaxID=9662 RepID=UPI001E69F3E1|nr:high affinity immunoglobulin epsilon receptor subunit alpha isoform X2 [Meles meles]
MPVPMGGPALLWMALLLFSPHGVLADISKPMVSLNPPWNRILKDDSVTLTCYENNSLEVDSAVWTHNGNLLGNNTSRFNIVKAHLQDSGEYRCRDKESNMSDPVHLEVFTEWLLLQAAPEELTEGEPLHIRCHSWRNLKVTKVTYYRNGKALKYGYENFEMPIPNATVKDNGSYYCTGWIKRQNHTSDTINIIVKKSELPRPEWSPKENRLATISDPIVGGDSVCCGHRTVHLDPAAADTTLEDSEDQKE